nr:hydroxymethylglutaryl-CoA reductase [Flavilitoribacter nigricans]
MPDVSELQEELSSFWHTDADLQRIIDGFSENTLSNYYLPFGLAPNFLINGQVYAVPMVIEESSVVAAAASAAKFWSTRGGFQTRVIATAKLGQLHFHWKGKTEKLHQLASEWKARLLRDAATLTANMEKRGGGVIDMELIDFTDLEPDYHQLRVTFETCDSMGANFINSVLEQFGESLQHFVETHDAFTNEERDLDIIMAILSNYTPNCLVRAEVRCPVEKLAGVAPNMDARTFAERFARAVRIARIDPYRAVTHNKGIFNGIDAVVLATANDFRAVEAGGHAYAARDGQYRSLSECEIVDGEFRFWLEVPLALGTVGGLTKLHPLAKRSLEILGKPSANQLMQIIAATGLAQNFAALRSLITTGIQQGHMKMHLMNILNHLGADVDQMERAVQYFADKVVSFTAVRDFLQLG